LERRNLRSAVDCRDGDRKRAASARFAALNPKTPRQIWKRRGKSGNRAADLENAAADLETARQISKTPRQIRKRCGESRNRRAKPVDAAPDLGRRGRIRKPWGPVSRARSDRRARGGDPPNSMSALFFSARAATRLAHVCF
jgi:hypothetical protein